jgi:hypothetical protein
MADNDTARQWDVLLVVTSDRYASDYFGTVRRLIDAALEHGYSIQVWACGYATMLTQRSPAASAPQPVTSCATMPAVAATSARTADMIGGLVTEHADRFSWLACRTCSDDRGAGEHIAEVPSPSLSEFRKYVDRAEKIIYIGGT